MRAELEEEEHAFNGSQGSAAEEAEIPGDTEADEKAETPEDEETGTLNGHHQMDSGDEEYAVEVDSDARQPPGLMCKPAHLCPAAAHLLFWCMC